MSIADLSAGSEALGMTLGAKVLFRHVLHEPDFVPGIHEA